MREAGEIENDARTTVDALTRTVEFLNRYDRLHATLHAEHEGQREGNGRSALTGMAEDGLAAARRVLERLTGSAGREGTARGEVAPRDAGPGIRAQRRPPARHGHGDPGE